MYYSPADVLRQAIVTLPNPIFYLPSSQVVDWALFVSEMDQECDNCLMIKDSKGLMDGRYMIDGTRATHPGLLYRFRAKDNRIGYDRLAQLLVLLDKTIKQLGVVMPDGSDYYIQNVIRSHDPIDHGEEPLFQRTVWTFDGYITLERIS